MMFLKNAKTMKISVIPLLILWPWFDFTLCSAIPTTKMSPLPCWLVQGSRFHVCADSLIDSDRRDGNAEDKLPDEPIAVDKRLTEYFKQLVKQSQEITSFSHPESSAVIDWFKEAINRAMAAVEEEQSRSYKRKFDSIGYHYRIGFGK